MVANSLPKVFPSTGHPRLDRIFETRGKARLAATLSLIAQPSLCVLEALGCPIDRSARYSAELHWWYLFMVLFPAFILLAPRIESTTTNALLTLSDEGIGVFRPRSAAAAVDSKSSRTAGPSSFLQAIRGTYEGATPAKAPSTSSANELFFRLLTLALLAAIGVDCVAGSTSAGWAKASKLTPYSFFAWLPYLGEGIVATFMVAWLVRFRGFLTALLGTVEHEGSNETKRYDFVPLAFDPARRLGLGPLARAFDYALLVSVLFSLYALLVRIETGTWSASGQFFGNLRALVQMDWRTSVLDANAYGLLPPAGTSAATHFSAMLPCAASTLVLATMVWFPLFRWRAIAGRWKSQAWKQAALAIRASERQPSEAAGDQGAQRGAQAELDRRVRVLGAVVESTVWPNGAERAGLMITLTALFTFVAWFPNLLVPIATCAAALRVLAGAQALAIRFGEGR